MKTLSLSLPRDDRPLYVRLAEAIRQSIKSGHLGPTEKLPSLRHLSEMIGAHRLTVMSALQELVAEGWLESSERRHYRVSSKLPSTFFSPQSVKAREERKPTSFSWKRLVPILPETTPDLSHITYPFLSGHADLRLFPHHEFRSHLLEGLKRNPLKMLTSDHAGGYQPLIDELSVYLRRIRGISDRKIIVTYGSQEALSLCAKVLIQPGDTIAVEALGYQSAWQIFQSCGAKLSPLAMDEQGIDPDAFRKMARQSKIRLLYMTPLHQFPTTVTLPVSRRLQIYDIALRYNISIIEDDYDHEFHYDSQPLAPIASHDPAGLVIYVATFSKIVFPSCRIGFMAVPEGIYHHLVHCRDITTSQHITMIQDAVARWMREGGFDRHLRRMRRTYLERRDTIVSCVHEAGSRGYHLSLQPPSGGMAIWLNVHQDAQRVAHNALKQSVFVNPEKRYQHPPCKRVGTHLRMGFANQTPNEIRSGFEHFLRALK